MQGLEKAFEENENLATQLGRINTYTAHTLLFFQLRSTLSNRPNWGSPIGVFSLARAIQSDPIGVTIQLGFPNWGYDPIWEPNWGGFLNRKSFLIDVMPYMSNMTPHVFGNFWITLIFGPDQPIPGLDT